MSGLLLASILAEGMGPQLGDRSARAFELAATARSIAIKTMASLADVMQNGQQTWAQWLTGTKAVPDNVGAALWDCQACASRRVHASSRGGLDAHACLTCAQRVSAQS